MKLNHHNLFSPVTSKKCTLKGRILPKKLLAVMRLTVIILLSACMTASASGYSQKITLLVKNAPIKNVFSEIRKQSGYEFLYTIDMLQQAHPVNVDVKNAEILDVLELCFKHQPFSYTIIEKTVVIRPAAKLSASGDFEDEMALSEIYIRN